MQVRRGNIYGIFTILLYSSLALFSIFTSNIPAFELTSLSFFVASFVGLAFLKKQKVHISKLIKIPAKAWIIGISGLFGYHFFYFLAIKNAPAVEANLINYLWPLLIVIFSSFLPNERLRWFHILGTIFGLLGAFLLVSKGGSFSFETQYTSGYIFAIIAALIWSSYSVISRTLSHVPTFAVTGFCMATAILSGICHFIFETTVIPNTTELFGILMLGLGPVGGAFYLWDFSVKNADIKLLGSISYFTPLLSTLLLVVLGYAEFTTAVTLACIFIIVGSFISSAQYLKSIKNFFFKK
ncbi:EamA family transporter [Poseidonibacter lekithochrous]|uniref:aromatic amino acid exporter YddG n=1 Tax=Poseidonibacter TaxID=2321187 RepID=UPI001C0A331E|nr:MULTISPECIES: EamA family transporter [Poseidonibacter]MBU3015175.1 EamA family transporter [Poseidonibacter lekithochrous]MDO6828472.1 EamA family transporter [Poseidonibacter sp. 1_MG-2023]